MADKDQERSPSDREEGGNRAPEFETAQTASASARQRDGGVAATEIDEDRPSPTSEAGNSTEADNLAAGTLALIAAALGADRIGFLRALYSAVGSRMSLAARGDLFLRGNSIEDEAAVFDLIATTAVEEAEETVAATICAALAARTIAQSLQRDGNDPSRADEEALISAWMDAARSLVVARGAFAMQRLLSTARLLAQRAAERRESAADIAAIVGRLALRIAADSSLERTFGGPMETQKTNRIPRASWARRAASSPAARLT